MKQEFNLSKKIEESSFIDGEEEFWLEVKDVREFVRRLKEDLYELFAKREFKYVKLSVKQRQDVMIEINKEIDKLAGEELR